VRIAESLTGERESGLSPAGFPEKFSRRSTSQPPREKTTMTIKPGDRVPYVTVGTMTADGPDVMSTADLFAGKTVALFGLPGAFTKTCSSLHLPGFIYNADKFKEKGVDSIACLSVNDPWVMDAWAKDQKSGDKIVMLADGALNFTREAGLEVDLNDKCYGPRCKRFSALVEDGVVKTLHFEEGGFGETSAERLLEDL
ncbi:peroxiredoxin, partial [Limnoraphis robusta CCNP1315]